MDNATPSAKALFPQLFANGYVPLPNKDKRCLLKGWPSVRVDQRQVDVWSRSKRWPAVGIRMRPPLVVVDVDVLDAELAAQIGRLLPPGSLRKIGKAPKEAHFLRLDDAPFYRIATRRWAPDVTVRKPAWSAVEVFGGGGGGKQFGAFGPHKTDDKTGEVLSSYSWPDGRSPFNTPLSALPAITVADVHAFIDIAERLFRKRGLTVDNFTRGGMHQIDQVFDLDERMVFKGNEVAYDLAQLEAAARAARSQPTGQVRVTGSFTGDPHSEGSLRCRVGISHFRRVYVHDFKTGLTHHPIDAAATRTGDDGAEDDTGIFADIIKLTELSNDSSNN